MGKSLKILFFMYILTKLSFAQVIQPGIYCHRGGNGKFTLNLNDQTLAVSSLFSDRQRKRMFESENVSDHHMLELEGSELIFTPIMTQNGYMNIKAQDDNSQTFINMNIKEIEKLLSQEKSKVSGDITIYSFDLDPEVMFQEYKTRIRCELN